MGAIVRAFVKKLMNRFIRMAWWEGYRLVQDTVDPSLIFRLGLESFQQSLDLGSIEDLARSGVGGWLLAQEKARLDFTAARESFSRTNDLDSFRVLLARLIRLHSTNALVHSLMNERAVEQFIANSIKNGSELSAAGRHPSTVKPSTVAVEGKAA
jgi:hypothetical protein